MTDERLEGPSATDPGPTPLVGPAPTPAGRPMTMAEYEEATSPRGQAARARGLAAPYIAGGRDPDPAAGHSMERRYLRLLILMVAAIILGGFAISILGVILVGGGTG